MSVLIVVFAVSLLALLAALPGDFARRGGTGNVVTLGSLANAYFRALPSGAVATPVWPTGSPASPRSSRR